MPSIRRARRPNWSLARTTIERPSGRLVGQGRELRALGQVARKHVGRGKNSVAWRLPSVIVPVLSSSRTLTSPAASTARPDMASTLCWRTRSMPAMPMAESRPPIVVGIRHTSRAMRTGVVATPLRIEGERTQRHRGDQEDDRQPGEQDRESDFVGGLLARGAFDEGDHPVEEGLARVGRDLYDDPVRENARAARDGGTVASRLADDGRRFAGDGRFVHGGDALDHGSVAGNDLSRFDDDAVSLPKARRGNGFLALSASGGGPSSRCARGAGRRPAPCRVLRPWPRRSSRRGA